MELSIEDLKFIALKEKNRESSFIFERIEISNSLFLNKRSISNLSNTLSKTSDRVKNVYEGGMKTWECSIDLIKYLEAHIDLLQLNEQSNVIEIGCGAALPGIYLMKTVGLVHIDFQDYNKEVLSLVTLPNIIANGDAFESGKHQTVESIMMTPFMKRGRNSKFYYGGWDVLKAIIKENHYDLILGSEILYEEENYNALYQFLCCCLKRPNGKCIIASKSYYFGLEGSSRAFQSFIQSKAMLHCKLVPFYRQTVHRDILIISWHDQ